MNELNRPETAEQKLFCCLLLFLVSFWWHLVKPSAGLQPYKSLKGGHVMSTRNATFHLYPWQGVLSVCVRMWTWWCLFAAGFSQCIRAKNRHSGHSAELLHQIVFTVVILSKPNIQMSSSETMEWPSPDNTTSNRKLHAPKKDKQRKDKMIAVFQLQYLTYRTMYKMCQSTSLYKSKVIWHPEVKFFLDLLN